METNRKYNKTDIKSKALKTNMNDLYLGDKYARNQQQWQMYIHPIF